MSWYTHSKQIFAQALNINGPIMGLPGAGLPQAPVVQQPQHPQYQSTSDQTQLPFDPSMNDLPAQLTTEQQSFLSIRPPLHDRCHCTIKTLPGGRMVWDTNETACEQCRQVQIQFNQLQDQLYG